MPGYVTACAAHEVEWHVEYYFNTPIVKSPAESADPYAVAAGEATPRAKSLTSPRDPRCRGIEEDARCSTAEGLGGKQCAMQGIFSATPRALHFLLGEVPKFIRHSAIARTTYKWNRM